MRVLKPFVLAVALVAAPAANAQSVCEAIQHAAKVGASDNRFIAFRREMPAPAGFECRINQKGRIGAYACSMPVEPGTGVARTKALIADIRACVAPSLIVEQNPRAANAVFMISNRPKTWVIVNGADDPTRIYMNVVVSRVPPSRPSGSFQVPGPVTDPYAVPFDPGTERPHYPAPTG